MARPLRTTARSKLDGHGKAALRGSLIANCYARVPAVYGVSPEAFLASKIGKQDLAHHLDGRAEYFLTVVLPWLEAHMDLGPMDVLEIGAGTGSSTAIFGVVCRTIHAIDMDPFLLTVARDRLRLHGLQNATTRVLNGARLDRLGPARFDLVLYIATLEHMTYGERLKSLASAWDLLRPGGFLVVVDTPNRLWYFDGHTGMLPFFHWLPDELAIPYTKRSPREAVVNAFSKPNRSSVTKLARWGRGVSYHEFDLAIGLDRLEVVSSLQAHRRGTEAGAQEWWEQSPGGRYQAQLREVAPEIPLAFLEDGLNLIVQKRTA